MIFVCENPERDWINDLREAERVRDLPPDEPNRETRFPECWSDPELWTEDDDDGS